MDYNSQINKTTENETFSKPETYTFEGNSFEVEPVFKDQSNETLGMVLLRLISSSD